jgi:lycopene cyclase domain-containing protein
MQEKYLYLWIDFLTILFPLVFSFLPINPVYKKWKAVLPALTLPAILFLIWDAIFTARGVWGFNPRYITGIYFFNLPLEEVLWFVCIPYACIFSYEAVLFYIKKDIIEDKQKAISTCLVLLLSLVGIIYYERIYTLITFLSMSALIGWTQWIWKPAFFGRFYLAFLFILVPFFIVNGILTGTGLEEPIVWYNNAENLNIRMGTIPIEDTFYGMLLILMNISLFEYLQKKSSRKIPGDL